MLCALPECSVDSENKYCCKKHGKMANDRAYRARKSGRTPEESDRARVLGKLADVIEKSGIDLNDVARVDKIRINEWQGLTKDENGEAHIHDLEATSILLTPSWAEGPKWPVVQPADPVNVHISTTTRPGKRASSEWKTALVLPDTQFGFRRDIYTDQLDPFHCERSLDVALQIAEIIRPDLTIWLGDTLDFGMMSVKYLQEPGFALTAQPGINTAHKYIAMFAALSDESRILEGNHDRRLPNLLRAQALAAFGLKRADAAPDDWPVLSVPNLLALDTLGVEYVGGYPAAATYINDNLACVHGSKIGNKSTSSASMVVDDERVTTIYGHVHRIEQRFKTRNVRGGGKISQAVTPGCLCRIDGSVPSVKGAVDDFARPVRHWEDWQNGIAVIKYKEGDGEFDIDVRPIINGRTFFGGELIESRV